MNEHNKKRLLKNLYNKKKINEFQQSLPILIALFKQLFEFLDINIEKEKEQSFTLTQRFCSEHNIDFEVLKVWFIENGAGDDIEVLWNIEEKFDEI